MSPGSSIFYRKTFPLILGVFLLSVIIRIPNLDRPLSKHHEFCTALALRIIKIWGMEGIDKYGFNPVMNYPGEVNKYINNYANTSGEVIDDEGNYYYISHPPFGYYLPFFSFSLLNIKASVLNLQLLNIIMHFISALFIYMTVCLLSKKRVRNKLYAPAFVAFVFYLFSPPAMWFQSNVYMSDMLVHVFFIIGLYTTLKMIIRERFSTFKYLLAFFISIFLMVYTSWLGVFFTFALLIYGFIRLLDNTGFFIPIVLAMLATTIALILTVCQFSSINGYDAYFDEAFQRFLIRSSLWGTTSPLDWLTLKFRQITLVFFNYIINYAHILLLIAVFFIQTLRKKSPRLEFSENGYRFIWLSTLPVVLLHLVFLNYSGHDFTALYGSAFFAVLMGIMYDKMKAVFEVKTLQIWMVSMLSLGLIFYFLINKPGNESFRGFDYAIYENTGYEIRNQAEDDEIAFMKGFKPNPQIILAANRNVKEIYSDEDALNFLNFRNINKGIIFEVNEHGILQKYYRININP